eukprot:1161733-Pelagomonas_calceolata.AAC.8
MYDHKSLLLATSGTYGVLNMLLEQQGSRKSSCRTSGVLLLLLGNALFHQPCPAQSVPASSDFRLPSDAWHHNNPPKWYLSYVSDAWHHNNPPKWQTLSSDPEPASRVAPA